VLEDVRVRALAAGRADEDAVSLVPGSFEVGYVAEDGSAHRVALTDALRAELARHHDTNDPATADRDEIIARAARSIAGLDGIISRVHRQISQR